jgi:hypothetical protein
MRALRVPDLEPRIVRREELLLLLADVFGDMRLAIQAECAAVDVDHDCRVEVRMIGFLEEA